MSLKTIKQTLFKKKILYFAFAYLIIFIIRTFFGLKHNSLSQDVARDLVLTERRIEQKQLFVAYGPKTSVGKFDLGPFYYQLHLWLSYLTGNHAYTMKFFTIALESLTPILVFLILKEYTSKKISLAAAGLYVFAGLPLIFGTSALNPNTIPFFTTLAFLGWIHYFKYHRKWGLIIGPLAVAITSNLHYQAVVLVPFLLLMFCYLLIKDRAQLKYLILGSFLGCLIYLPYFVAEISQGWPNTLAMINYFQTEHSQYYARVSKPVYVLTFIPSFLGRVLTHQNNPYRWLGRVIWFGGGVALSWQLLKAKQKRKKLWLISAVYFGLILIMLRVYKGDKLDYYMSTLYLLPFILLGAISKVSKQIVFVLILIAVFLSGSHLAKLPATNDLSQLNQTLGVVATEFDSNNGLVKTGFLFHFNDFINLYSYALAENQQLVIDQNSLSIVEVCAPHQKCQWDQTLSCKHGRAYTYASLVKSQAGYESVRRIKYRNSTILLGKYLSDPEPVGYSLYGEDNSAGHDYIYPQLYFYNQAINQ